jgi:quercetin dioxygenase-like cupin family protein
VALRTRTGPLQQALGIETFGANLFVGPAGRTLVSEHDESGSGQQDLYVVLDGSVAFHRDGEEVLLKRGMAVAVTEPSVRRSAKATAAGTALLAIGASGEPFRSTWDPAHFTGNRRPR